MWSLGCTDRDMNERVLRWVEGYRRAWDSNSPDDIRALFTEDATYHFDPYHEPLRGREAIVDGWLAAADAPGSYTFQWNLLAETEDVAFVRGETRYLEAPDYSNLWVIRFGDDSRASDFTDWWVEHELSGSN
ncbi:MAG: hypothetical protein QOI70_1516 [Microbacteriaceae bacterium]|nr:hypothetical protein [Microbacteriaceae bacterium]